MTENEKEILNVVADEFINLENFLNTLEENGVCFDNCNALNIYNVGFKIVQIITKDYDGDYPIDLFHDVYAQKITKKEFIKKVQEYKEEVENEQNRNTKSRK